MGWWWLLKSTKKFLVNHQSEYGETLFENQHVQL